MKIIHALYPIFYLAALTAQVNAQEPRTITIATEGAFPPWNAVDSSGNAIGFDVDVGKALCERAKLKCKFVTQAWDGIIPGLIVGKYDAVMAGMSITEKRKEVIAFSEPYALTSNYFVMANSTNLPGMDVTARLDLSSDGVESKELIQALKKNLKGKILGVQSSTNAEAFVREHFGNDVEVRTYDKQDNLNLDLLAGRIDGGLADYSVWKTFLDSDLGKIATLYGPRISGGLFGPGIGIGLRKQDLDLNRNLNNALDASKKDGTLSALSIKWFGIDLVSN
ncbi:transporter substrate-binding domain-containing protein [Agrobacterium rubi]|uniref:transporter substrate-binding domain-containing protein n=1 Tax=Agrobacterium rubi TaxID=28099 RepID=UPI001574829D|nr:transporter substrate-binding domain-containing protein [Agrobacterium rubi]NTF10677.1 transporter substrate-binding domain-containing protein [Agrobacterium rubi]NTF23071.1 transporter substrate-binding domain-containing protein [Agrobacterium rubi]NTF30002.1 transporter substrate-binding domain-containing protein [Agrobacterium rubi]